MAGTVTNSGRGPDRTISVAGGSSLLPTLKRPSQIARRRTTSRRRSSVSVASRSIVLPDGRLLGYDDVGPADGVPVFFFHGFGSSRVLRYPDDEVAASLGIRLICPDRPGIGYSTPKPKRRLIDWPVDVQRLADACGVGRFGIIAWSGGGPYALASGWAMPDRVAVVGLVSAAAPLSGVRHVDYLEPKHRVASRAAKSAPWAIRLAMWRWARQQRSDPEKRLEEAIESMIEADQQILADPRMRAVMIANTAEMQRQGNRGLYDEALVMARRWGFPLDGVKVPVHLWHGESDITVPADMGRYLVRVLPRCDATFYPGEGHHLVYDRWAEILTTVRDRTLRT
jgi:pimeloyl-ACP methyl ester carboxylesterase